MAISIKSSNQIEKMRTVGKLASSVLEMIGDHVKTGITTEKLDQICHDFIVNDLDCICLLYTSPSPRDKRQSRMPSSA